VSALAAKTVIVGVGLLGASLAAAGRRSGALARVTGVGRSQANLDTAMRAGVIDEASTALEPALAGADLVVLAAPVDACVGLLARIAAAAPKNCVITDVASVKFPLVAEASRLGIAERFVGAHPMAGGTSSGAGAADVDLFRGRTVVLTPEARTDAAALERVERLWRDVGARTVVMDARAHDRIVALASHLPQMIASALAAQLGSDQQHALIESVAGAGLRDTTRIAMSDARMWSAIAAANRDALLAAMDGFSQSWSGVREAVARGDAAALEEAIEKGAAFRRSLERK
jgi:prephenate dehydrogenase